MRAFRIAFLAAFASAALFASSAEAYTYKVIYNFCSLADCADGKQASSGVIADAAGVLYGTTSGPGTVFSLTPNADKTTWTQKVLHRFCQEEACTDGWNPRGQLIMDTSGALYGTTINARLDTSFAYRLSPNGDGSWTYTIIARLQSVGTDAAFGLTYAGAASGTPYDGVSPLYGVADLGGNGNGGSVFRLKRGTGDHWTVAVLHYFCDGDPGCAGGAKPSGNPVVAANGALYGVAANGGNPDGRTELGAGVAYQLVPRHGDWQYGVLYRFCSVEHCRDGAQPNGALTMDAAGRFYGATTNGGKGCKDPNQCGTVFSLEIKHGTARRRTEFFFCRKSCEHGHAPYGNLVLMPDGTLLGSMNSSWGRVFTLKDGIVGDVYRDEDELNDGFGIGNTLLVDPAGNIFGTMALGGPDDAGAVFEITP